MPGMTIAGLSTPNIIALMGQNTRQLAKATQQAASGNRIVRPEDDAAGYQHILAMKLFLSSSERVIQNAQAAGSLMAVVNSAMGKTGDIIERMKYLALDAANGSATDESRRANQLEFDGLGRQLRNIIHNTEFGGEKLFKPGDGKLAKGPLQFQIGVNSDGVMIENLSVGVKAINEALGKISGKFGYGYHNTSYNNTSNDVKTMDSTPIVPDPGNPPSGSPGGGNGDKGKKPDGEGMGDELLTQKSANQLLDKFTKVLQTAQDFVGRVSGISNRIQHTEDALAAVSSETKNALNDFDKVDYSEVSTLTAQLKVQLQGSMQAILMSNKWIGQAITLLQE